MKVVKLEMNVVMLPMDRIVHSEHTARLVPEDASEIAEFGKAIIEDGLFHPITVRPIESGRYEILWGHRRFNAALSQGVDEIPGIVRTVNDVKEVLFLGLAENLQRKEYDPFEEAVMIFKLMKYHEATSAEVCRRLKKSATYVQSRLQLLDMPERIQEYLVERKLGISHIPALGLIPSGEERVRFAELAIKDGLTAGELYALVRDELRKSVTSKINPRSFSPGKVRSRAIEVSRWARRVILRVNAKNLTASERFGVISELEEAVSSLRIAIKHFRSGSDARVTSSVEEVGKVPRNRGEVYPSGDDKTILASDPEDDEALAKRLGRSVPAIKSRRSLLKR